VRTVISSEFLYSVKNLISQGKPISEMLSPNIHDIKRLYSNQFQGITRIRININLKTLQQLQASLAINIRNVLTEKHRLFLIGFKTGSPDWSQSPYPTAKNLPAILWKQKNMDIMDRTKRQQAIEKLTKVLKSNQTNG